MYEGERVFVVCDPEKKRGWVGVGKNSVAKTKKG